MKKNVAENLLDVLSKQFNTNEDTDFIGDLLDDRMESICDDIYKTKEYLQSEDNLCNILDKIEAKFENHFEIIRSVEEYESAVLESEIVFRSLMYRHGIYDGINLVLKGINEPNIQKILEEVE